MEMDFPVYVHGMMKMDAYSRAIDADDETGEIVFRIPEERRAAETRVTINYSPSLATAMVEALPYLVDYPYGCTEQTLNRFVPTVVARRLLQDMGYNLSDIRDKRSNLNAQILGNEKERAAQTTNVWGREAVWDDREVAKMERVGIKRLRDHQNPDSGWGWFGGGESYSYPHTTAVVMHGLLLAKANGSKVPDDMIASGLAWLEKYEQREVSRLASWEKKDTKKDKKEKADAMDAFVRMVLGEGGKSGEQMLGYLFRDKNDLPVYAKALLGLELARVNDVTKRDEVVRNIRQFLVKDDENQTAYLDLRNGSYWWWWYGSDYEAQAWFLKLLAVVEPKGEDARGLAKYLVNNRKNGYYWRSTRDTAYCLEALGAFIKASGESAPDMELDVVMDGKVLKTVKITKENLFSYESRVVVAGDVVTGGQHKVELRKRGSGVIYANAYVEYFTLEDFIPKAGLEVKVDRAFYKLVPDDKMIDAADSKGQVIQQKRAKLKRVPLKSGDEVKSGDLIEVELSIESKNDYEYLVFEDWKAAGMEAAEVQSGYNRNRLGAYMELRDEKVALFVQNLPRGRHNLSYRLRAEIPGKFSALPTVAEAMYAPELRANSDEMKVVIGE